MKSHPKFRQDLLKFPESERKQFEGQRRCISEMNFPLLSAGDRFHGLNRSIRAFDDSARLDQKKSPRIR